MIKKKFDVRCILEWDDIIDKIIFKILNAKIFRIVHVIALKMGSKFLLFFLLAEWIGGLCELHCKFKEDRI